MKTTKKDPTDTLNDILFGSDDDDNDISERDLYLINEIDEDIAKNLIADIVRINREDDKKEKKLRDFVRLPITIFINSPGGCMYSTLGILDIISESKTPIHTKIIGVAASAAGIIFMAGHKRYMNMFGTLMYHNITSGIEGNKYQFKVEVKQITKAQKLIDSLFLKNSILTKDILNEWRLAKVDKYIDYTMAKRLKMITEE